MSTKIEDTRMQGALVTLILVTALFTFVTFIFNLNFISDPPYSTNPFLTAVCRTPEGEILDMRVTQAISPNGWYRNEWLFTRKGGRTIAVVGACTISTTPIEKGEE